MYISPETRDRLAEAERRAGHLFKFLEVQRRRDDIVKLEEKMSANDFWNSQQAAKKVIAELNENKAIVGPISAYLARLEDAKTIAELVAAEAAGAEAELAELDAEAERLIDAVDELEISSFLSGPMDKSNAIMTIKAGAGGTEACDWADLLFRMYFRWAERRGFKFIVDDVQDGEGAGIATAIIRVEGPNAYGYLKAERGVHRLVRISPYDANARRHTSFASIDVVAEVTDDIDVTVTEADVRKDTYRSGGKGGQHVNKTDSAVRLTHLATGIVVACQRERSQIQNYAVAMQILKSRLYEKLVDDRRSEMERYYGEKGEVSWGNQIRSYVFQPYQMVKDLRTGVSSGNIQGVMDGDLDPFINGWLRAGGPRQRNKDIRIDD